MKLPKTRFHKIMKNLYPRSLVHDQQLIKTCAIPIFRDTKNLMPGGAKILNLCLHNNYNNHENKTKNNNDYINTYTN